MSHKHSQNNSASIAPEELHPEDASSEGMIGVFAGDDELTERPGVVEESAELSDYVEDDLSDTEEDVSVEPAIEPTPVDSAETIAELEKEHKVLESKIDELTGQLAKTMNQMATREGEFQKLAEGYRKLREALDKIDVQHKTEFDNYRRRTEEEKKRLGDKAIGDFMSSLLPSLDNLDRAMNMLDSASDIATVRDGVTMIVDGLKQVLASKGLERMISVGEPFNAEFHNAMATVASDSVPEGYVVDELVPGYTLKGQLLRPAMVRVAHAPDEE